MRQNFEIRESALRNNVKHWQIAQKLGIQETNFSRMLRTELPEEKKSEILKIISVLSKQSA